MSSFLRRWFQAIDPWDVVVLLFIVLALTDWTLALTVALAVFVFIPGFERLAAAVLRG